MWGELLARCLGGQSAAAEGGCRAGPAVLLVPSCGIRPAAPLPEQVGTLPAYAGLTLGGILSTSAHGSGDNATSNLCDTLISVTWVDVNGNVRVSARNSDEVRLFCGGLGLIGIMTELELQLTPPTHTKLITRYLSNDTNMVKDIEKMLRVSPHMLVFWRPDMKTYRCARWAGQVQRGIVWGRAAHRGHAPTTPRRRAARTCSSPCLLVFQRVKPK